MLFCHADLENSREQERWVKPLWWWIWRFLNSQDTTVFITPRFRHNTMLRKRPFLLRRFTSDTPGHPAESQTQTMFVMSYRTLQPFTCGSSMARWPAGFFSVLAGA